MNVERLLSRITLAGLALLFAFGVCELLARFYLLEVADPETFKRFASVEQLAARHRDRERYSVHRYLGYTPTPNFEIDGRKDHNSLGFRGAEIALQKPPGQFRIACLGGSTTYTLSPSYEGAYPQLLEGLLRSPEHDVRVINAGAHGYSSFESLINLELRVLDLDPDLVIIYHGVNDVSTRFVFPFHKYRGDNSGMRGPRVSRYRSVLEYSALMRLLLISTGRMESPNRVEFIRMSIGGTPEHTHHERAFIRQKLKGVYPDAMFAGLSAAEILETNDPRYFERNIHNMIVIAKAHGVTPVVATFASMPGFEENPKVSSLEFRNAIAEQNAILRELVPRLGGYLFDFERAFPDKAHLYLDGEHVNRRGARLKAELFASYLRARGLVPGSEGFEAN